MRFLLLVQEAFSKYVAIQALKNKTALTVLKALQDLFDNELKDKPVLIFASDKGTEYENTLLAARARH